MKSGRAFALGIVFSALTAASSYAQVVGSDEPYTGPNGPYLRAEGGWSHLNDMKGSGTGTNSGLRFDSKEGSGFIAGGAAGWKFGQLRMELGLDFSGYDASSITVSNDGGLGARLHTTSLSGVSSSPSGKVHVVAGMVNTYWDFRTGTPFVPYIGIGIGAARDSLDNFSVGGHPLSNGSDVEFAYQPMVGVRYLLTDAIALGVEYRYFATVQPTFKDSSGQPFNGRIESHNVLANLSYYFGAPPVGPAPQASAAVAAPPPPPPPPLAPAEINPAAGPPPTPVQTFIVYFELGRATLSPQGRNVADAAVAAFKQSNATQIELAGFTDTSGSARYDEALSRRRAETVRDYLVAHGVPLSDMTIAWHGKQDPRVPTGDNTVEAQNRRVEINIP